MNKSELIAAIAEKAELSKKDSEAALKAFTEVVTEELSKGEKVQLVGFGTFEVSKRPARSGVNPQTKKELERTFIKHFCLWILPVYMSCYAQPMTR